MTTETNSASVDNLTHENNNIPTASLPVRIVFAGLADWLDGARELNEDTPNIAKLLANLGEEDCALLGELKSHKAGAFVSFHNPDGLRGCIGTIFATCDNVFEEICQNMISAAGHDPRFPPISAKEVFELSCSVDVLTKPEPVQGIEDLDAQRYGILVSNGRRQGVLLPNLANVETPVEQLTIALRKAGLTALDPYELQRFEVVRYS